MQQLLLKLQTGQQRPFLLSVTFPFDHLISFIFYRLYKFIIFLMFYSINASTSTLFTLSSFLTLISLILQSLGAVMSFSIFIAINENKLVPCFTSEPSFTLTS